MKVFRAGAIYTLGNIASAAVPFLLLPLLTRVLRPSEYGSVVAFALLVTLSGTVAGLNVHGAVGVAWFKRTAEQMHAYTATALALAVASTLVVAPLLTAALWAFPRVGSGIPPYWGAIAVVTAGANVILQCRLALWQSQQKALPSALLQFAASLVNVGLSLVAVLVLHWGGAGRNAGIAGAAVLMSISAVALLSLAGELRWAPSREDIASLIMFGLPLVLHIGAGVLLGTADRWTVSLKLDARALGIYGAGAQLGSVMAVLSDAFVKAYNPWLYGKLASPAAEDKHRVVGAIYAGIPIFLVVAALVGFGLFLGSTLLLGPQYRAAAGLLPWFALGGAFTGIYTSSSVLFFFSARTFLLAMTTMSAAVLGAIMTWFLVGTFGVHGAAAGYCFTQALLAVLVTAVAISAYDLPWKSVVPALSLWFQDLTGSADNKLTQKASQ